MLEGTNLSFFLNENLLVMPPKPSMLSDQASFPTSPQVCTVWRYQNALRWPIRVCTANLARAERTAAAATALLRTVCCALCATQSLCAYLADCRARSTF